MALVNRDRVLETSTTTGSGTYTLAGAVIGFQTFAAVGDGNTCYYSAWEVDAAGSPSGGWEVGLGTYTAAGTTLARTTVLASSNGGAAVSWPAGTRRVAVTLPAEGTLAVRQPGGTPGTDDVLIQHDGDHGEVISNSGSLHVHADDLRSIRLDNSGYSPLFASYYSLTGVVAVTLDAPLVAKMTGGIGTGSGWLQQTAGRRVLTADATNATATMADLSALTFDVIAGRRYTFKLILFVNDSVAAEGAKFDFDGGTATMTDFRAHGTLFDTALLLSQQVSALATDLAVATVTGDGMVEVYGSFTVNAGGAFIPRFAQNTHAAGTLTTYRGSFAWLEDCP